MSRAVAIGCLIVASLACVLAASSSHASSDSLTSSARRDLIRRSQVWMATDIAAMDLEAGPSGARAFEPGETVRCDFVNRPRGIGSTLKFSCAWDTDRVLKVRYGEENGEVYAQVAATRLLWALGFAADRMYPVRVICRGCSTNTPA